MTAARRRGDVMLNRRRRRRVTADEPRRITHAEMDAAADSGFAVPLGPGLGWMVRYGGGWWVEYEHGWLQVLDEATERDLDAVAARLAEVAAIAGVGDVGSASGTGDVERNDPLG